jgi:hypothetical protein
MGQVTTNQAWAQFAALTGDTATAKQHLDAANDAQSQIDPTFSAAASNVSRSSSSITP